MGAPMATVVAPSARRHRGTESSWRRWCAVWAWAKAVRGPSSSAEWGRRSRPHARTERSEKTRRTRSQAFRFSRIVLSVRGASRRSAELRSVCSVSLRLC